jgi:TPR repeat protein
VRALPVFLISLLVMACSPEYDRRIVGDGKPVEKELPPIPDAPGKENLAAGYRAYDVGDYQRALQNFREAADKGMADAQYFVGLMHAEGEGTTRSYAEAAKWYEKAAAQNHADALFALAKLHVIGGGVPADSAKALELYERAEQAYPPGEKRDQVAEQRLALAEVLKPAAPEAAGEKKDSAAKTSP